MNMIELVSKAVRERFNPEFVGRFQPETSHDVQVITDRIVSGLAATTGGPRPIDVYYAAWQAAKEQGLHVFDVEDDGTEFIADPAWNSAWKAAFAAAIAYAYPDKLTTAEVELLVARWEAVVPRSDLS